MKHPIKPLIQSAAAECGLACAGMLIGCLTDRRPGLQDLRRRYDVTLRGLSLGGVLRILADHGLVGRPLSIGLDRLKDLKLPCILHWRFNHYVVLEQVTRLGFRVLDPASGRVLVSREDADAHFTGIAVEVVHQEVAADPVEPGARLRLHHLFPLTSKLMICLGQVLLLTVAFNAVSLVSPLLLKVVYDDILPQSDANLLLTAAVAFAVLALVQGLTLLARGAALTELRRTLSEGVSRDVFSHLVWLASTVVERRSAGTIATNYRSVTALTDTLSEELLAAVVDGLSAIILVAILFWIDPWIGAALATLLAVHASWIAVTAPGRRARLAKVLACEGQEGGFFVETVTRLQPIRMFQAEGLRVATFSNLHGKLEDVRQQFGLFTNLARTVGETIVAAGWVLVVAFAALRTLEGAITLGTFAAVVVWVGLAVGRGREAVSRLAQMDSLESHVNRVADILQGISDRPGPAASEVVLPPVVRFGCANLSFRYGDDGPWLLQDCTFSLERGQWVSIAGQSGVGKSTLVKILTGLLHPSRGTVLINGQPMGPDDGLALRRRIGVVMQNDGLFGGSLRDNITFFDPTPDIEHMHACADIAGIHEQIEGMPMRYESLIGEQGAGLSAGQLQRIMLARALYRRPDLLILDEFTANLDEAAERTIIASLKELGIAILAIAHRRAVIEAADVVLLLDGGSLAPGAAPATALLAEDQLGRTQDHVPLRVVGV